MVTGTVKDAEGTLMPGVSIIEKGTSNGTTTDAGGKFTITVGPDAVLVFSFIGTKPQEFTVGNQTSIDVTLQSDASQLDEFVVIGYGVVKKSDLTGSVASVSGDDLRKMPVATVGESLIGRLAGVQVTTSEGSPDAEIKIRVRGGGSITQDNSPLYIVDGFPVNTISDIAPSDIQSIDVLKDASATAIYGSRGANGVIIITTKSGKSGKLSVSYNAFTGFKRIAKTLDVLSVKDYVNWQYEYAVLDNDPGELESYEDFFGSYQDLDLYDGIAGVNWQEQVYGRTGTVFSQDLSLRGGTDKFNYSVNYARFDEKAIMIGSDYLRNNVTLKLTNKPSDKIELNFSLRYSNTKINGGGANEQNEVSSADSRLKHSLGYSPIMIPGLTADADDTQGIDTDLTNPIRATADNDRYQERRNYNMAGSFAWQIIENLKLRTDFGLDTYNMNDNRFYGLTTYMVRNKPTAEYQNMPAVTLSDRKDIRFRNTNTLSYDFKNLLPADHHVNLMVGHEMIKTESSTLSSEIHGFPTFFTSDEAFRLTTQGKYIFSVDNNYRPDDKLLSFFGRVNYDFKGRYLFTATYRADGSSKFLDDNRWGYFPSAAAAWKISEESFMAGTKSWINNLKLRASFGMAGNNNIPTGQTFQSFESTNTAWIDGFTSFWAPSKTMANPDLKWETTTTRNIGLDFDLLNGRLNATLDAYLNNTKDLLINFPVPGTGYDYQYRNMGETENKGLEVSLGYSVIEETDYGLSISFNTAFNRGKIKSLGLMEKLEGTEVTTGWASTQIANDFLGVVGSPVGMMYGYQNDGRYEVSDFEGYDEATDTWILKADVADATSLIGPVAPGMMKLKDNTGDGLIDSDDRKIIGNANPKFSGGFVLNAYAYGFDLTAAFSYSVGNDVYNANKIEGTTANQNNQYRNLLSIQKSGNRWTNIDPATGERVTDPTALAALNENTTLWSPYMSRYVFSDWAVEDGSFLRLNTLTLGYSVPSSLLSKYHIENLRFYVTGYNVFLLTDYSGFDPEVSTRRKTPLTPGVDYSAYPRSKQIVFGLSLNF
jgi:TonB-linked SusC/RagA family outer membrane protein